MFSSVLIGVTALVYLLTSSPSRAASIYEVTPAVIDMKGKAREVITASLRLANSGSKPVEVYPFVENIDAKDGARAFPDPAQADLAVSLANWILVSRASVLIPPGGARDISFSVEINMRAKPGVYHALIAFAPGATRDEAMANRARAISTAVNVEVLEDIRERMQLITFRPERLLFSGFPVSFSYEFENIGNRAVQPVGEIRIYNRRGREVASVPVNSEAEAVTPDTQRRFAVNWMGEDGGHEEASDAGTSGLRGLASSVIALMGGGFRPTGFGKYKAYLDVEYGSGSGRAIQDTVYFWIIPWPLLLAIFLVGAGGAVFLALGWHRRVSKEHETGLAEWSRHRAETTLASDALRQSPTSAVPTKEKGSMV